MMIFCSLIGHKSSRRCTYCSLNSKELYQATTYDDAVTNVFYNLKGYKGNEAKKN